MCIIKCIWRMKKFLIPSIILIWNQYYMFLLLIKDKFEVQTSYVNNKDLRYSSPGIWSDELYSWWWYWTWVVIALWWWRNSWRQWQWNTRKRPSHFLCIYWRSPYRRHTFCIIKRSTVSATSGKLWNKKLHQS